MVYNWQGHLHIVDLGQITILLMTAIDVLKELHLQFNGFNQVR